MSPILQEQIQTLSLSEKIQLVQDIWDDIAASLEALPISEDQQQVLEERLIDHQNNPDDVKSWEEVQRRILNQ